MVIAMLVNIYTGASLSGGRCKQARVKSQIQIQMPAQ